MYYCVHSLRKIRALRVLLVSPRFDVTLFGLFRRNANLRRSALSALRLLRVMYFCVHSPQTSAAFAHNLYLRVLTVTFIGLFGRNAYKGASCVLTGIPLARLHLSKVAAVNLPASGAICNPSPRFDGNFFRFIWGKRVSAAQYFVALVFFPSPPASPFGKGRCHPTPCLPYGKGRCHPTPCLPLW